MLLLLLLYFYISVVCLFAGLLFYALFLPRAAILQKSPIQVLISGLLLVTLVAQWMALWLPLNLTTGLPLTALLFAGIFLLRKKTFGYLQQLLAQWQQLNGWAWVVLVCSSLCILVINAGPTRMDDTDSYHIQLIGWLQQYGTVPGIANLHERYGFNSSWFSSISIFMPGTFSPDYYKALNGLLCCWTIGFFLHRFLRFRKNRQLSQTTGLLFVLALLIYCWPLLRATPATTNYDFITTLAILVLFIEALGSSKQVQPAQLLDWICWPALLFTVRIINYPFLLLAAIAVFFLVKQKAYRLLTGGLLAALVLVLPFIARNIMLSGYPFFPSLAFDWWQVDWKADPVIARELLDYIKYFNRVNVQHLPLETTKAIGFPDWIPAWASYLYPYDKVLVIASGLGALACMLFRKSIWKQMPVQARFVTGVCLIHLVSWFMIAPDPRFAAGSLLVFVFAGGMVLAKRLRSFPPPRPILIGIALFFAGYSLLKFTDTGRQAVVRPLPLPKPKITEIALGNVILRIPNKVGNNWNPRCYGTAIPCLYRVDPRLELRGNKLSSGFRLRK